MTAKQTRALKTLDKHIAILKARLAAINERYSNWNELKRELADFETVREMITEQE